MLEIYKKYNFTSIYLEVFILILLWLSSFIAPTAYVLPQESTSALFELILHWLNVLNLSKVAVLFILFCLQVFAMAFFSNRYKIFETNTFIAGLVFIVLLAPPQLHFFNPVIIANFFIIRAIYQLPKMMAMKKSILDFFKIAVMMAIATIVYPQYLVFLPFFSLWMVITVRSKLTKEVFVVILGFFITYLLFYEMFYLTQGYVYDFSELFELLKGQGYKMKFTWSALTFFIAIALILVFATIGLLSKIGFKTFEKRIVFQLSLIFSFITILTYVVVPSAGFELWYSLAIPVSFIISDFFINMKLNYSGIVVFWSFVLVGFIFSIEYFL